MTATPPAALLQRLYARSELRGLPVTRPSGRRTCCDGEHLCDDCSATVIAGGLLGGRVVTCIACPKPPAFPYLLCIEHRAEWEAAQLIGPCACCHETTSRYGPDGGVLCAACRADHPQGDLQ